MLFLAGFGWAKPVPVNPLSFTGDMRRGMLLVSLAGPVMNLVMAVVAVVVHLALMDLGLPYFTEIMF